MFEKVAGTEDWFAGVHIVVASAGYFELEAIRNARSSTLQSRDIPKNARLWRVELRRKSPFWSSFVVSCDRTQHGNSFPSHGHATQSKRRLLYLDRHSIIRRWVAKILDMNVKATGTVALDRATALTTIHWSAASGKIAICRRTSSKRPFFHSSPGMKLAKNA